MTSKDVHVLQHGDERGNGLVFNIKLPSGREIYGLGTTNFYMGGDEWELGPTWNYLVRSEQTFLVDTGKRGAGPELLGLMESVGIAPGDIDIVLLSHGHEDHDGGLCDIADATGAEVMAHEIYGRLIRFYPHSAPEGVNAEFPASCWHCPMPEEFWRPNCVKYHKERAALDVTDIAGPESELHAGVTAYHIPGHSPDSLAILIEDEALLVGDTVLPQITPHPSMEGFHSQTKTVLQSHFAEPDSVYGLRAYIRSLKKLKDMGRRYPDAIVLPAHRLYYHEQWNHLDLAKRVDELQDHHVNRCADILDILKDGPKTNEYIVHEHFEAKLLKGFGMNLGVREILSHCELMSVSGDVVFREDGTIEATGTTGFESLINALLEDG